jgi:hypothetical protein
MRKRTHRRGFAIATAVFTLVVVGALAMGTLFAAIHELRSGSDAVHQAGAVTGAELGVEQTIATWSHVWNGAFARGFGRSWSVATPEGAQLTVRLTRLADELFLVASEARAGPARRQVARVVRLDAVNPVLVATLSALAAIDLSASARLDGTDRAPLGWDCPAPGPAVAPFAVSDSASLLRFGQFDWTALAEAATARLTPGMVSPSPRVADQECDTTAPENWGEPIKSSGTACTSYYAIVHAPGDLIVDGGRGQGLLIVDGDLTLRGSFEFFGVILVRGTLRSGSGGARITGAASIGARDQTSSSLGGLTIEFSRCAARKALLGLASPIPIVERSWYEVFDPQ